ncbi:O-fucosyltransferase 20-like isoform X1 [Syzygium oleosum]|uniref:O-fucosyltransferase 20-like isoform X1 n=1 Tax=Syzygium oleosum TaxID=219896 RepID=UPI0024BB2825|nr:O-fucosyltransferase 20-like isoform X1 [Syzygium oleosum]
MSKPKKKLSVSYITVPSQIINSLSSSYLQSLLVLPKKPPPPSPSPSSKKAKPFQCKSSSKSPKLWFSALFLMALLGMLGIGLLPLSSYPCATSPTASSHHHILDNQAISQARTEPYHYNNYTLVEPREEAEEEHSFWKQPEGMGYRGCLEWSKDYRRRSERIVKERRKYVMMVVSGGINQQRNQIVDAVVIARILEAVLVVPVFQVNVIWGDDSEFSDIFDLDHFKRVLANDVRVISSLPSTHIRTRPVAERPTSLHISANWIRSHYLKRLEKVGVLLLRGLDSRLSKDLPSDLQKLRCKVAFHALKFAPRILGLGNKLAERMQSKGPYIALHLRMEKDVWVRTGCLPGLSPEYDELIDRERKRHPELLTAKSNITCHERKLAGLCPLNALEVARLLKALGAPKNARIYWAGGQPLGGKEALSPLTKEFPHFYSKQDIALPGELEPFANKASFMASIDFIICERSDVFMPSHGGNMGHALQGQRAYAGHRKYITPNKRHMLPYFLNTSLPEPEFNRIMRELHRDSLGQPELRTSKVGRDVTKYPIPDCMCNSSSRGYSSQQHARSLLYNFG